MDLRSKVKKDTPKILEKDATIEEARTTELNENEPETEINNEAHQS